MIFRHRVRLLGFGIVNFEIYFTFFECIVLAIEQYAGLLFCITLENELLFALVLVGLWSAQEIHQVNERNFTEETPNENLIVLLFVSFFHFVIWILVTKEGIQVVCEVRCLTRLDIYRVSLCI